MNNEEIKNEFINCIEGTHTVNLAISVLEDREEYKQEIERLQNIIKEAKEYIKGACWLDEVNKPNSLGHKQTMKVFEILDKEVNNESSNINREIN